jgi:Tfp pilus assembly protein PilZ
MRSTDRFALHDVTCDIGGRTLAVANLSVGGFFVVSDPPLPLGQSVAFELTFSDGWRASAVGRVVWVNGGETAPASPLPIGCGITITQIAFPDKLAIVDRLRRATEAPHERRRGARAGGAETT